MYDICLLHRTEDYNETWILYEKETRAVVGVYPSRDDVADAWARAAKLPVCSNYIPGGPCEWCVLPEQ